MHHAHSKCGKELERLYKWNSEIEGQSNNDIEKGETFEWICKQCKEERNDQRNETQKSKIEIKRLNEVIKQIRQDKGEQEPTTTLEKIETEKKMREKGEEELARMKIKSTS